MTTDMRKLINLFCTAHKDKDIPLKLVPGIGSLILADARFFGIPTEVLVERARRKLKTAPADRAIAIAIIQGVSQ